MKEFDAVVIGGGPAGLTAALYLVRGGFSTALVEKAADGGQVLSTAEIENYPGIAHVSGFDFAMGLSKQATDLGAVIKYENVVEVTKDGSRFRRKAVLNVMIRFLAPVMVIIILLTSFGVL